MHMLTAGLIHALPPTARRGFDRKEAASYVGVSVGTFDKLVKSGDMPKAILLNSRKVWDKRTLDRSLDRISGLEASTLTGQPPEPLAIQPSLDSWRLANAEH